MRDFSSDTSALSLNTATLGHNLNDHGAGWPTERVIDACAANGVALELNANPLRLDIDYTWLPYAIEKEVYVSINPDAHSKEGIHHTRFGVLAARKGGLPKSRCLNAHSCEYFEKWLRSRR